MIKQLIIGATALALCVTASAEWHNTTSQDPTRPPQEISYTDSITNDSTFVFNKYSSGSIDAAFIDNICRTEGTDVYFKFWRDRDVYDDVPWGSPYRGYTAGESRSRLDILNARKLLRIVSEYDFMEIGFRDGCDDYEGGVFQIDGVPFSENTNLTDSGSGF